MWYVLSGFHKFGSTDLLVIFKTNQRYKKWTGESGTIEVVVLF
jgi:hypothetical protein